MATVNPSANLRGLGNRAAVANKNMKIEKQQAKKSKASDAALDGAVISQLVEIQELVALGLRKGGLTYDEINTALPKHIVQAGAI